MGTDRAAGSRRLAFVGLPGAGKSSVGRRLARLLGLVFEDSDAVIERELGESIRSFFVREGEARFRCIEAATIERLCADLSIGLLATGGGVVTEPANRRSLRTAFTVVYLHASPDELHRRLRRDSHRPLLQGGDLCSKLRELYEARHDLYRDIADFVVETGRPTVPALVDKILIQLKMSGYFQGETTLGQVTDCVAAKRTPSAG